MDTQRTQSITVWSDLLENYRLLDSGNRQKLETIGGITIVRSEPRAWWKPALTASEWNKATAYYGTEDHGRWVFTRPMPEPFSVSMRGLTISVKCTKTSKHIGIFPEQVGAWERIEQTIRGAGRPLTMLNLFGYTGLATLSAARAGAAVTHVDASKTALGWARENQALSGLEKAPIRWILDDATKFVKREVARGVGYDAIVMDPPAYGRGHQGQVWKIEEDLPVLLEQCRAVLSPNPVFVMLTTYAIESSSLSLGNLLGDMMKDYRGVVTAGELALPHESSGKLLPLSIFAMWEKK
ncbi:class I SAM-dependent methyltransferase [Candidatus Kaiserbacteria bacterium]|nr:class I SAM-dependent methyltransferase [Candidatus Kaiserbacteria bacterium]